MTPGMDGALEGVRVLEVCQIMAGPLRRALLGGLGSGRGAGWGRGWLWVGGGAFKKKN